MIATRNLQNPSPPLTIPNPFPNDQRRVIAFTTPSNYAGRLSHLLQNRGWTPLWCPTVIVEPTHQTKTSIQRYISFSGRKTLLEDFSAIAFTSRTGISAFSEALSDLETPPLSPSGHIFTLLALGKDSELLDGSFVKRLCTNSDRIRVVVPAVATPSGLVDCLELGRGRKVLCPVPLVVGITEPPVVPNFLRDLSLKKNWVAIRLNAYQTRWAGPKCAERVVEKAQEEPGIGIDAIVFTSTAEVDGLLRSLGEMGLDWGTIRKRCPCMVVAAHGPVTTAGAESLGLEVDVVSSRFDSFDGVVDALAARWQSC